MKKKIMGICAGVALLAGTFLLYQNDEDDHLLTSFQEWIEKGISTVKENNGQKDQEKGNASSAKDNDQKETLDEFDGKNADQDSDTNPDTDKNVETEDETKQGMLITTKNTKESETETEEPGLGYGSPLIKTKDGDKKGETDPQLQNPGDPQSQEPGYEEPGLGSLIRKKPQVTVPDLPVETEPQMQNPGGNETEPQTQNPGGNETEPQTQNPGGNETEPQTQNPGGNETEPQTQKPGEDQTQPDTEKEKNEIYVFMTAALEQMADEIKEEYEEDHPDISLVLTVEEDAVLYQKIKDEETCDVYLSASLQTLELLAEEEKIDKNSIQMVAEDPIVLIQIENGDTQAKNFDQIPKAQDVVIAEETTALGKASREVLQSFGVYDQVMDMDLSEVGNANAVLASVSTKSSELGIVYGTDAAKLEEAVEVIAKAPSDALQEHVYYYSGMTANKAKIQSTGDGTNGAEEFLSYLDSEEAADIFEKYGFSVSDLQN